MQVGQRLKFIGSGEDRVSSGTAVMAFIGKILKTVQRASDPSSSSRRRRATATSRVFSETRILSAV